MQRNERAFGGTIDPITGTVDLTNMKNKKKEARLEDAATAYLRGETDKLGGRRLRRVRSAIDEMRGQGYEYDPNAATEQTAGPINDPTSPDATTQGTSADGTAGNFGRFFTSPDYQFRLQEGTRAIDQSAAARGGLFSGNTGKAVVGYGSNLAAGEYGNYVNRLLAMAGLGQTATGGAVAAGQNYANGRRELPAERGRLARLGRDGHDQRDHRRREQRHERLPDAAVLQLAPEDSGVIDMPLDPIIARGGVPLDVTNTLYTIGRMKIANQESERRDQYQNALLTRRTAPTCERGWRPRTRIARPLNSRKCRCSTRW